MTICPTFAESIKNKVEKEHKDLKTIAEELCGNVKFDREKIIRVIKDFIGEDYLIEHADVLKYDAEMAKLARKRKSYKKIDAKADSGYKDKPKEAKVSKCKPETKVGVSKPSEKSDLVSIIQELIHKWGIDEFMKAVEDAQLEET